MFSPTHRQIQIFKGELSESLLEVKMSNGSSSALGVTANGRENGIGKEPQQEMKTSILDGEKILQIFKNLSRDSQLNIKHNEVLDLEQFGALCKSLFGNGNESYPLDETTVQALFNIFDLNANGVLCKGELANCYETWVKKILNPVSALVIIDVQNDFISGSLALKNTPAKHEGSDVIEPVNRMLDTIPFDKVFYSIDWHPPNHISFADNVHLRKLDKSSPIQEASEAKELDTVVFEGPPLVEQKLWPRHCVQNTWGAQLHDNLKILPGSQNVYKGTNPEVDSYSALFDNSKTSVTPLKGYLEDAGITDVYICGLAYDYCVGSTADDALTLGYRTVLVDDATRGITPEGIKSVRAKLKEKFASLVDSDEVKDMVAGVNRKPELGIKLALEVHKKRLAKLRSDGGNYPDGNIATPKSFLLDLKST